MTKKAYVGVNGKARRIKKGYVGVGGVARKLKKAYIGVGGVARPCWSGGELAYWGTATALGQARGHIAGASVGNYGIFWCGGDQSQVYRNVDVYDETLLWNALNVGTYRMDKMASVSIGDYALFSGGDNHLGTSYLYVQLCTLDRSLTYHVYDCGYRCNFAGACAGDYALFGGGENILSVIDPPPMAEVEAYDASFVRTHPVELSQGRYSLAAVSVGPYALFAGGVASAGDSNVVDAYNETLTRSTPSVLSQGRSNLAGASVGNYALFAGGAINSGHSDVVDAYDETLTRSTPLGLSQARSQLAGGGLGDYALFAGGVAGTGNSSVVDVYDDQLIRSTSTPLNQARYALTSAVAGNTLLFGGGFNGGSSSTVDAYTVV